MAVGARVLGVVKGAGLAAALAKVVKKEKDREEKEEG